MQPIDILRNKPKVFNPLFQFNESVVCRVWVFGRDQFTSPVIPFPDKFGISGKGIGRSQFFSPIILPQTISLRETSARRYPLKFRRR